MKKKILLFTLFVVIFSVMMAVPAFAACNYCSELSQDQWWHCKHVSHFHEKDVCPVCFQSYTPGTCTIYFCEKCYECGSCERICYCSSSDCEHDWSDTDYTNPTCNYPGYSEDQCYECGVDDMYDFKAPLGHNLSSQIRELPTCTSSGYHSAVCNNCGKTFSADIPASSHQLTEFEAISPTCTSPGTSGGEECEYCDYTTISIIPATGHQYTNQVVPATCTENGYTIYTCNSCGDSYTDNETLAIGHNYIDTIREDPTCTQAGKQYQACICGDVRTLIIDPLRHDMAITELISPTCIKQGYTIRKCVRCEESEIVDGSHVSIIDHEFRNGICSMCGALSSNGGSSSGGNGALIIDEEEEGTGKKFLSLLATSAMAGASAFVYDNFRKKGGKK